MSARHALPDGHGGHGGHDGELLGAHLLGVADPEETRRVEHLLAGDPARRREMEELRAMTDLLGEVPPEAFLDGPPDADLVLRRALQRVRDERARRRRRRFAGLAVAAAVAVGAVLAGGVLVGRATAPQTVLAQPAVPPGGERVLSGADGPVAMTATLTPAAGWVRVAVSVVGVPQGERCRVVVVGRDGRRETAGGWVVSAQGERTGTTLSGSASVAPDDVAAVVVENEAGHAFVTLAA